MANTESDSVSVLLGVGGGAFATAQYYTAGYRTVALATGDLNADGMTDIAAAVNDSGVVAVLLNQHGLPGDLNCDGVVNLFDIDPFVWAITDPDYYATQFPHCDRTSADVNADGVANLFDVDPFILLLTH